MFGNLFKKNENGSGSNSGNETTKVGSYKNFEGPFTPFTPPTGEKPVVLKKVVSTTDIQNAVKSPDVAKVIIEARQLVKKTLADPKMFHATKARVICLLDASYSMDSQYDAQYVQRAFEKILGAALTMDSNNSIETYSFADHGDGYQHPDVTIDNIENYVKNNHIQPRGCTYIADIMKKIVSEHDESYEGVPTLVFVLTDGSPSDPRECENAIIASSYKPIFWCFYNITGRANCNVDETTNQWLNYIDDELKKARKVYVDNVDAKDIGNADTFDITKGLDEYGEWVNMPEVLKMLGK